MHYLTLLLMTFASLVLGVESPIPGYKVVEIAWEVEIFKGEPPLILFGTVQEVHEQILQLNPDFEFTPYPNPEFPNPDDDVINEGNELTPRDYEDVPLTRFGTANMPPPHVIGDEHMRVLATEDTRECYELPRAKCGDIQNGIAYLHTVPGHPVLEPGINSCGRVSCSWDSAIWWCNDNDVVMKLHNFGMIAYGAGRVINQCRACTSPEVNREGVSGVSSFPEGWRTVVKKDEC